MFEKQKKRQLEKLSADEQMRQREPRPGFREKKETAMLRTYEEPVLPRLCRIIFIFMPVITAAMLLVDLKAFFLPGSRLGILRLLSNLSTTGFLSWLVFTGILFPLCVLGIVKNRKAFYRRKKDSGIDLTSDESRLRCEQAVRRLNSAYRFYLKFCLAGSVIWGISFLFFAVIWS